MNDNKTKLVPPEALPDDALDQVAGGIFDDLTEYLSFSSAFRSRNDCYNCNNDMEDNCPRLLGHEGFYKMFDGNPNATCPYKT